MSKTENRKNLGYLGEEFQFKLVNTFLEDKDFFKDLSNIIDQNMFTNPLLKTVVGVMKEFHESKDVTPSYSMVTIALNNKAKNDIEREQYQAVMEKIKGTSSDGVEVIRDLAEKFFKQQNIIKTANEILRIAGNGDIGQYERCVELLNETLQQGTHEDLGTDVFDLLEETLSDDYRIPIPTGIGKLDEALEGGLGKGELGVVIGSSSFGKAQPLHSKILTPDGFKLMGDMQVGDKVIGRDGKPYNVSGVFPQGVRPIYKITFSNGAECECDIEHLWLVNETEVITLQEIINRGYKNGEFSVPYLASISTDPKSVTIVSIDYQYDIEAQCIMVDSEEHLYVTDGYIVTHNTSLTTSMAAHAATYKCEANDYQGFKVVQIVFEDRIKQIQRKHIGKITGIEAKDLSKPDMIENVRNLLNAYGDMDILKKNLRIKRFPSGEITAAYIGRYIRKLINTGFKPDMVIVDYFECLEHQNDGGAGDTWINEGKTMRKFESLAGELDIAMWIPVQGTRDSVNMELVTMDKAGGSFKKIQIAHIVMSIARTMEDIESNKATIALLKNRAGKSGKVFNNVTFNNGTCRISTEDVDEYDNMISYNKGQQKQQLDLQREIFSRIKK